MEKLLVASIVVVFGAAGVWWYFSSPAPAPVVDQYSTAQSGDAAATTSAPAAAAANEPAPTTSQKPQTPIMSATLHTNKGDITIEFNSATPNTVANFIKLAQAGFYNNTKFHRVIKGFMIQGGDPLSKDDAQKANWGRGGPGYTFADEIGPDNHNNVGTIAMANAGPNTNGSQFFISAANNNFLDQKHTVFGRVTAGLDVALAIDALPTDSSDRPLDPVIITSITLK